MQAAPDRCSGKILLNGVWRLTYAEGDIQINPWQFTGPRLEGRRLLAAPVPAPIHQVLMDAGWIEDINVGLNSLKARWVEEMYWVYRHTFTAPEEAVGQAAWITFACLEYAATVWLNGAEIGRHANAHRPARFEVTGKLTPGENLIVVQLTTGMHEAAEKPIVRYAGSGIDLLTKRQWQRKPEYQCGWDWNPRLMNVGILGDVTLEWARTARIDQVSVFAEPNADYSQARVTVRVHVEALEDALGVLRAVLTETGQTHEIPVMLRAGMQTLETALTLDAPRLWQPRGVGAASLYTVEATLDIGGERLTATRRTGVRRIEIDQSKHPETGRYFILQVNGRPIFCKGANWVPGDLLYSAFTPEREDERLRQALDANFNFLRLWGGAHYATEHWLSRCDEEGILVWHDFPFGWSRYPGDDPEWLENTRQEFMFHTRGKAHHPSLIVWCGNNEIAWNDHQIDGGFADCSHTALFAEVIPEVVRREAPHVAHWLSSPWSPDGLAPNDPTAGDQHPWGVSLFTPGPSDYWAYRGYIDRFADEGGNLGMSSPATLRQFLPERERYFRSPSWEHHDNWAASGDNEQGALGHAYQTIRLWTGRDAESMPWEEYAFASGLLQAEGMTEYLLNYRRRMFSSAAVFWMYNDSWPVTHGWTIVDYYGRRKLAYHPVRRAFQPVTIAVVEEGDGFALYGVNDTDTPWAGEAKYGRFAITGGRQESIQAVTLAPNASTRLAGFPRGDFEPSKHGAFAVLRQDGVAVAQCRLLMARFHDLPLDAAPEIALETRHGRLTLTAETFVWGVCLDPDGEQPLSDDVFDLLPGVPYSLPWPPGQAAPPITHFGNLLLRETHA